jgi:hypothetical protein
MKTHAIALILLITVQSPWAQPWGNSYNLVDQEQEDLIAKADAGDPDAAYQMYTYHLLSSRNKKLETKWLNRAAELGHPKAQRWLAHMIADNGSPHKTFGKTPEEAVLKLLTDASKTYGLAASDLGKRYQKGYFDHADKEAKARAAYIHAAALHCALSWEALAPMLHNGEGGAANQIEAYYYICLGTQCTHPDSVRGQELWKLRHKIEAKLSLEQVEEVWRRVDAYISKERKRTEGRIYPPPLLGTGITEKQWNEWLKTTDEFEDRHRKELQKTMGKQVGGGQPASGSATPQQHINQIP